MGQDRGGIGRELGEVLHEQSGSNALWQKTWIFRDKIRFIDQSRYSWLQVGFPLLHLAKSANFRNTVETDGGNPGWEADVLVGFSSNLSPGMVVVQSDPAVAGFRSEPVLNAVVLQCVTQPLWWE